MEFVLEASCKDNQEQGVWCLTQALAKLRAMHRNQEQVLREVHDQVWEGRNVLTQTPHLKTCVKLLDHAITRLTYLAERCPEESHEALAIREVCRDVAGPLRSLL